MPYEYSEEDKKSRRLRKLVKAIPIALLFASIAYFWGEIKDVLSIPWSVISIFFGMGLPDIPPTLGHSFVVLAFTSIFGFGLPFLAWLFLFASQAWLPVSNMNEMYQTAVHFIYFALGKHGPAVFVKDGMLKATPDELRRHSPGVLVIDYNSAVALESVVPMPQRTRICGPGITFTSPAERIYGVGDLIGKKSLEEISGVVDLRILFRMNEK
jgi:hypothetical protein